MKHNPTGLTISYYFFLEAFFLGSPSFSANVGATVFVICFAFGALVALGVELVLHATFLPFGSAVDGALVAVDVEAIALGTGFGRAVDGALVAVDVEAFEAPELDARDIETIALGTKAFESLELAPLPAVVVAAAFAAWYILLCYVTFQVFSDHLQVRFLHDLGPRLVVLLVFVWPSLVLEAF